MDSGFADQSGGVTVTDQVVAMIPPLHEAAEVPCPMLQNAGDASSHSLQVFSWSEATMTDN